MTIEELEECYDLLQKLTRRCVRDMKHMMDDLKGDSVITREEWQGRLRHYELVLGGTSDYRNGLYVEIQRLEFALAREMNKSNPINKFDPNQESFDLVF